METFPVCQIETAPVTKRDSLLAGRTLEGSKLCSLVGRSSVKMTDPEKNSPWEYDE
jgi:hypothetical protein